MLIWYWSSDVCSSDLCACTGDADVRPGPRRRQHGSCHQLQLGQGGEARVGLDDMAQATPAPADSLAHGLGRGAVALGQGMGRRRISLDLLDLVVEQADEGDVVDRSEEHTSELQSLMRISYAVFCLK